MASAFASDLSQIALRLTQTPANSVPSERSFSTLNLLLNDLRNSLGNEKVNMLQYIYMNERVLARTGKQLEKMALQHMGLARDEELVELEDGLLQAGELGVESSKRERELEEEEEETAVKRQRYNTMTEIIS